MRKKHCYLSVVLLSLVMLAAHTPALGAGKEIITIPGTTLSALPAWVALKQGYFSELGLDVEVRRMRPSIAIKGMIAGEVAYTTAIGSLVRAAVSGVKVKGVMAYLTTALGIMMAKPEWKTIEAFKGEPKQVIGTETVGGTMEYMQRQFLRHYGLVPGRDVMLRVVGFSSQRGKALRAKAVDATIVSPPQNELLKAEGFNEIISGPSILPEFLLGGLGASVRKIQDDRVGVKKVIRASLKASRYISDNPNGTIDIIAKWFKVERVHAEMTLARLKKAFPLDGKVGSRAILQNIELARQRLKLKDEVPVARVFDFSLLNEALAEGK